MPGSTPVYHWPYPIGTDPLDDAVSTIPQSLALAMESTLTGWGGIAAPGAWTTPALSAGWVNFGSGYQPLQYRKIGTALYIRGLITRTGSAASGPFTAALPAAFRPLTHQQWVGVHGSAAGNASSMELRTDGTLQTFTAVAVGTALVVTSPPIWLD